MAPVNNWAEFVTHHCAFTTPKPAVVPEPIPIGGPIGGVHSNDAQFGWVAPAWPAWDAAKELWSFFILTVGITDPPLTGSAPYAGFETGMWGEPRLGIGAFDFTRSITPNVPPRITGQNQVSYELDTNNSFVLSITDLKVVDPDNDFPGRFTMTVLPGDKYTFTKIDDQNYTIRSRNLISCAMWINVKVNDGEDDSPVFKFKVLPVHAMGFGILYKVIQKVRYLIRFSLFGIRR